MIDNSKEARKRRRTDAEARQAEYEALSTEQKITRLVARVGTTGAVRESTRLTHQLGV